MASSVELAMAATDSLLAKPKLPPLHLTLLGAAAHLVPIRPGTVAAALQTAPRGDGHPVIVVPSFLRGDGHTTPLRRFLAGCGYAVEGWGLGANLGPTEAALEGLATLLDKVQQRHGRRVTLIGHSLGGVIARELAKQYPEQVRQLVLLASPIRLPTASPLEPVYKLLTRWHSIDPEAQGSTARLNAPPAVPVTALYTRSDGIVAWESCREIDGATRESIEVRSAHGTMVRNRAAWRIIADRLALPEGNWQPYEP
jgi:pimeloyl-ACP methyl ester carboxylesterase